MTCQLTIDVGNHPSLRGTWKVVGGDDLITQSGQNARMTVAEEIPVASRTGTAADNGSCSAEGAGGGELPTRQDDF